MASRKRANRPLDPMLEKQPQSVYWNPPEADTEGKYHCSVCGREISEEDYEDYDGMCWECWDDQLTEESEDMFGDVM